MNREVAQTLAFNAVNKLVTHEGLQGAFVGVLTDRGEIEFMWKGMVPANVTLMAAMANAAALKLT